MLKFFLNEEDGQGMVEYALLLALISLAAIVAITQISESIQNFFTDVANKLESGA